MPLFSFPANTRLKFDWEYPDPPEIEYRLALIEQNLEDTETLAIAAKEVAQADMEERFFTETDPKGVGWKELKKPARDQVGILRLSEDMFHDATSDDAFVPTPRGVFFRTDVLPDYWVYHEQPGRRQKRLPARKFIGLSAEAENQIEVAGDAWLAGAIAQSSFPRKSGTILGARGRVAVRRGPGGRFRKL